MRATVAGAPLDLPYEKSSALLAYLAVTGGRHSREALSTLLWGESGERRARASLRTALWHLRAAVEDYLVVDRSSVAFNDEASHWVDAVDFGERIDLVRRWMRLSAVAGRSIPLAEYQADVLKEAVDLYRGEFLAGSSVPGAPGFEEWVLEQREWARQQAVWGLHTLVSHLTVRGEYRSGLDTVARLLAIAPWQEEAHRERMLLLALSGERGEALAQYDACREVLAQALHSEPTLETELLYREIKAGKTFSAGGGPSRAPRLHLPSWCPSPSGEGEALVGRDSELAQLRRLLTASDARLTSLVGPEGVGKTRLAWAVAGAIAKRFQDGVWFVSCGAAERGCRVEGSYALETIPQNLLEGGSTEALICSIGRALGMTFSTTRPLSTQLSDYLCHRELLLVLDGVQPCPHLADFVLDTLRQAPRAKMLLIGNSPLGVEEEQVQSLHGLGIPPWSGDHWASPEELERVQAHHSARLYIERAERVTRSFDVTTGTARHVADICRLAGGLPLAIELAAAWAGDIPLASMVTDIESRLRQVPEGGAGNDVPPEVEATFSYVWDVLASDHQAQLFRLAGLRGEFGGDVAIEVCGVSKSQLHFLCDRALVARAAADRYHLHPVIRRLLLRRVRRMKTTEEAWREPFDASRLEERLSDYYLRTIERRRDSFCGREAKAALADTRRDWWHIRSAWCRAAVADDREKLKQGLDGLSRFTFLQGWLWEGAELFDAAADRLLDAVDVGGSIDDVALWCRLVTEKARLLNAQMRYGEAADIAATVAKQLEGRRDIDVTARPWQVLLARAHLEWGKAVYPGGEYAAARDHVDRALSLVSAHELKDTEAACLVELGTIEIERERFEDARTHLERALRLYDDLDDWLARSRTLRALCRVGTAERAYGEAEGHVTEALTISETMGDILGEIEGHAYLGRVARARADAVSAAVHYGHALRKARRAAQPRTEGEALRESAWVLLEEGNAERAWSHSLLAVELAQMTGHASDEAWAWLTAGRVFARLRMQPQAAQAFRRASEIHRGLDQLDAATESLAGLATLSLADGYLDRAQELVDQVLDRAAVTDLVGARDPVAVYLACYDLLTAAQDDRAEDVLQMASRVHAGRDRASG
jgi:DNA-binding SARP family transcriptional activator/predicted ATPase